MAANVGMNMLVDNHARQLKREANIRYANAVAQKNKRFRKADQLIKWNRF
jgi:hypothetical protein